MSDLNSLLADWIQPVRRPNVCPNCAGSLVKTKIDGRNRIVCVGCSYIFWDHPIPVLAAIVEHNDSDVILVRSHNWPENFFGLVSGFLEEGETPEEGILREVKEELGLDGTIARFIRVFPCSIPLKGLSSHGPIRPPS